MKGSEDTLEPRVAFGQGTGTVDGLGERLFPKLALEIRMTRLLAPDGKYVGMAFLSCHRHALAPRLNHQQRPFRCGERTLATGNQLVFVSRYV